ncbi:MAG: hypothetical protein COX80_02670 [Candidatus Magasanikbacteria bacterium CG_4_10_14_0_2_um_filter_33_14]|uniref:Pycsar effector protein domain-containing protein n=1 Tax=Candidatus Magasanikbacteria bacterium CG_4_10_14_0_2_um_filter_33_14 TaxID=1974636 RepID=A0A2M7VAR3_9BACT|nr:MAG: hypothetical protein COX80_02670 [Candidatus Magasanikbacteria bacterium CG_4_10_14_0_2_um_filter_33_14]
MEKINLQFLQSELNRVCEWIKFSDKKTGFLSAYYSTIFGLLISQKESILNNILNYQKWMFALYLFIFIAVIISFIIGMYFLFKSIFPRLKNSFTDKSLFYFGHIAKTKFIDFSKKMQELNEDEAEKQVIEQIYTNSIIANQKMKNVQISIKSFVVLVILVLSLILSSRTW